MRRPSLKLILVFLASVGVGFVISYWIMSLVLQVTLRAYGFGTLTLVAVLIALILVIVLDGPLTLHTFEWPEEKEKPIPEAQAEPPQSQEPVTQPSRLDFPYEPQADHWNVDFGDSKQTYEGTALPIWLLAGWAAFVLWAVIYLISGLSEF